jgi:hypothetical protein
MDYPELNLLTGLGLASTLGVAIGLHLLANRPDFPNAWKVAYKYLVEFALIAAGYAFLLLFPSLSLGYKVILILGILLIVGLMFLAVLLLRGLEFSRLQRMIFIGLQVACLGLIGWLVIVLIRSLIPSTNALLFADPLSLTPSPFVNG